MVVELDLSNFHIFFINPVLDTSFFYFFGICIDSFNNFFMIFESLFSQSYLNCELIKAMELMTYSGSEICGKTFWLKIAKQRIFAFMTKQEGKVV